MEAMFRSCGRGAQQQRLRDDAGTAAATAGAAATSLIRASAPIRRPPPGRSSIPASGSALMSTSSRGRWTFCRIRSTSVVPPARKAARGSASTVAMAPVGVGGPRVGERPHGHVTARRVADGSRIAARMCG